MRTRKYSSRMRTVRLATVPVLFLGLPLGVSRRGLVSQVPCSGGTHPPLDILTPWDTHPSSSEIPQPLKHYFPNNTNIANFVYCEKTRVFIWMIFLILQSEREQILQNPIKIIYQSIVKINIFIFSPFLLHTDNKLNVLITLRCTLYAH